MSKSAKQYKKVKIPVVKHSGSKTLAKTTNKISKTKAIKTKTPAENAQAKNTYLDTRYEAINKRIQELINDRNLEVSKLNEDNKHFTKKINGTKLYLQLIENDGTLEYIPCTCVDKKSAKRHLQTIENNKTKITKRIKNSTTQIYNLQQALELLY